MHSSLIAWIMRAIPFGTIIMYGALGETVTEKSGNLNLGVPGIMYLGGFAGFASAWAYACLPMTDCIMNSRKARLSMLSIRKATAMTSSRLYTS